MSILRTLNARLAQHTGYAFRRVASAAPEQSRTSAPRSPRQAVDEPAPNVSVETHPKKSSTVRGRLPPARYEPGEATATNFFDAYPLFYETSNTTPDRTRLNLRYEAIFEQNRDVFQGARVLDIASHDGRWSLAALQTGAAHVLGIEARPELVQHAQRNLDAYGVDSDRYRFVAGDVFDVLASNEFDVDVVICLGFLYHTLRYNELMAQIARCGPRHLIIDSRIVVDKRAIVHVFAEAAEQERNAVSDAYSVGDNVLIGVPSRRAIERMVRAYGFDVDQYSDWRSLIRDNETDESVNVYARGQRVTLRASAQAKRTG